MSVEVYKDHRCPVCGTIAGQADKSAYALAGWRFVADMVEAMLIDKAAARERLLAQVAADHAPPDKPVA